MQWCIHLFRLGNDHGHVLFQINVDLGKEMENKWWPRTLKFYGLLSYPSTPTMSKTDFMETLLCIPDCWNYYKFVIVELTN